MLVPAPSQASLEADIAAATSAIGAAVRLRGPTMIIWDLIAAMTSLWEVSMDGADLAARGQALDEGARRLTVLAVNLVGPRRARELVEVCERRGLGRRMQ